MATPPVGWMKANGMVLPRAVYAQLFAAIGTTYGAGDGVSTFTLPDLRGAFIRSWDDGRGYDAGRAFGSWQGDSIGIAATASNSRQPLTFLVTTARTPQFPGSDAVNGLQNLTTNGAFSLDTDLVTPLSISRTTLSTAKETRPGNVAMLACIKY
jgi:microcystin-dependent protein